MSAAPPAGAHHHGLGANTTLSAVFLPISWLVVCLRVWVRWNVIHSFGADDMLGAVSMVLYTAFCAALMKFNFLVPPDRPSSFDAATLAFKYLLASEFFYDWSILFLKLSLGLFFLHFVTTPWQRYVVYCVIVLFTVVNFFCSFFTVFVCGNPAYFLANLLAEKCVAPGPWLAIGYLQAATNTATDIALAFLPIPMLWNLRMSTKKKFLVGGILILATAAVSAPLFAYFVHQNSQPCPVQIVSSYTDQLTCLENVTGLGETSIIELGTGILASSLPTLRPLLPRIATLFGNIRSSLFAFSSRLSSEAKQTSGNNIAPTFIRLGNGNAGAETKREIVLQVTSNEVDDVHPRGERSLQYVEKGEQPMVAETKPNHTL